MDAVVAATGEDDANILACLYAKSLGAQETIAVLHRLSLRELLEGEARLFSPVLQKLAETLHRTP